MFAKFSVLLVFLVLAFCSETFYQKFNLNLIPGQIYQPVAPVKISPNIKSNVTISMSTDVPVVICFQEWVTLNGNLDDCNGESITLNPGENQIAVDQFAAKDLENFENVVDDDNSYLESVATFWNLRSVNYYIYFQNNATNASWVLNTVATLKYNYCNQDYEYGPMCAYASDEDVVNGTIDFKTDEDTLYYTLWIPFYTSEFNLFASNIKDASSSVYVYARREAIPTMSDYDFMGTAGILNASNPLPGLWYFMFSDSDENVYMVSGNVFSCGNGSVYQNGECVSLNATDLTYAYNNLTTGTKGNGVNYDYYTVTNETLVLGVSTTNAIAMAPPMFTSYISVPTNTSYMVSAHNSTINYFWLTGIPFPTETPAPTWIIAVWPSENYVIWANQYCPKNCSGKGNCTDSNGTCMCNKGYKGLYCQNHGLPLIVIILIAIGAAIILAIVIGVPVACYIRNSRKANYERV